MNGAGNFEWFPEKKVHEVWVGNYLMTPFFLENDLEVKNNNDSDFALKKKHIRDGHGMKWFDKVASATWKEETSRLETSMIVATR